MSIKYIFTFLSLLALSIFTGCFEEKSAEDRGLSLHKSEFSYKGAVERSISLKLTTEKKSISEIKALVQIPSDYSGSLTYKWMLGEGVKITEGLQTGQVTVDQQKKISLTIKVSGFNESTKRFIRFEIMSNNPQRRLFADGLVSSDQEDSFEQIVKEVEKYKENSKRDSKNEK